MLNEKIKEALKKLTGNEYQIDQELIYYWGNVDLYNEEERKVFRALSEILSLAFDHEVDSFVPEFVCSDGRRTYAIEDVDQATINLMLEVVDFLENLELRSKLAHILLKVTKNNQFCNQAVSDYLALYRENRASDRASEDWVTPFKYLKLAFAVAKTVKKDQLYQNVLQEIDTWIKTEAQEGTKSDFISIILIERFIDALPKESFSDYLSQVEKIQNLYTSGGEPHLIERIFEVKLKLNQKLNSTPEKIKEINIEFAKCLKDIASNFSETSNHDQSMKIHYSMKAVHLFQEGGDSATANALHKETEILQTTQLPFMKATSIDLQMEEFIANIEAEFQKFTLEESILALGEYTSWFFEDDLSQEVLEKQKEFPLRSLTETVILDSQGRPTVRIPPLPLDGSPDPILLKKHCRLEATTNTSISGIFLNEIRKIIIKKNNITLESLDFIIKDNPIIPDGRNEIIKQGLYYGLIGHVYMSMHLLLPQTENIFRNLAKECGDTVTKLDKDTIEKWKLLSEIFRSEFLNSSLNPEIIFTFQTLMEGEGGANLRNLVAHGMQEPEEGNSSTSHFFLVVLIKFLSNYSPHCLKIRYNVLQRKKES